MASRTDSSSQTLLLAIVLIITFPIWVAVLAALFGVVIGLFGAAIGVIAAIFGAMAAIVVLPFKILFGWHDWGFPHFHGFWLFIIIIIAALIVKGRRTT